MDRSAVNPFTSSLFLVVSSALLVKSPQQNFLHFLYFCISIDQNPTLGDKDSEAYGATYAIGGATVGYQHSEEDNVGGASLYYENDAYAISYSVNDDLAISYGVHESKSSSTGQTLEAESIQISYSVGGASIKFAETEVDNQNYQSGINREGRTIALTLAF